MNKILDKVSDFLLALLVAFSLVYAMTSSMYLICPLSIIFLLTLSCIILLYIFFYNKITSIAASALLSMAVIAAGIYAFFFIGVDKSISFLRDYFFWLEDYINYPESGDAVFQLMTVTALCIFVSIFSYIFVIRNFKFLIVLISGMLLFTIQSSYEIVSELVPFYLFLTATLISYLKHVYHMKSSREPNEYARSALMAVWSLPVCVLIIFLSFQMEASDRPIEWKWLDQKIFYAYNYLRRNFGYEAFDYFSLSATSGFGDKGNFLGGSVRLDRTSVLRVETDRRIYLKGATKDVYTGNSWVNGDPGLLAAGNDFFENRSDMDEMMQGMKILTGEEQFLDDCFDINPAFISFLNIKTKSIFVPSLLTEFKTYPYSLPIYVSSTGDYSAGQRLSKSFQYDLKMYSPKVGAIIFQEALRKSKRGLYRDKLDSLSPQIYSSYWHSPGPPPNIEDPPLVNSIITAALQSAVTQIYPPIAGTDLDNATIRIEVNPASPETDPESLEIVPKSPETDPEGLEIVQKLTELENKSASVYEQYLQLPETLPQRVKDLSASLVATADNDYDKAKAIEQYLSSNFPYNLDVRSTPKSRDFVDYFLFDQKEGYCSYYASAMAILARCAGLPARYIEGYMLPPSPLKGNPNTYIISNMQAHAWVEIYFEGYGWLAFEPTSPFRSGFYQNRTPEVTYGEYYNDYYSEYMELMKRYAGQGGYVGNDDYSVSKGPSVRFIIAAAIFTILVLLAVLILINMVRRRFRLYKMFALPGKECILESYGYFVNVLGMLDLGLMPAETPLQYSARIETFLLFSPVRFSLITSIFVRARYGTDDVSNNEKQLYYDFFRNFSSKMKVNMGKLRYFVLKYLLAKF